MAVQFHECKIDQNGCVELQAILQVFDAAIKEERAWAVLYQSAKTCESLLDSNDGELLSILSEPSHILIHADGHVHRNSFFSTERSRTRTFDESKLINGLGRAVYKALDYGLSEEESRVLSPDMEQIIDLMTSTGFEESDDRQGTDDEGIEQDSGDRNDRISLSTVLLRCQQQISSTAAPSQADSHYRAVCRALVAESLEFSQFVSRVSKDPDEWRELRRGTQHSCVELGQLHLADWAKLWLQVMRQLRNGVKLKKVDFSRKPIEFELTPYEMLMEDIRTRRYHLKKVTVDHNIPARLKKDAHQLILEFIRSRPPLRKVSDRKVTPQIKVFTPKERLLLSIQSYNRQGLRPVRSRSTSVPEAEIVNQRPKLRILKPEINFSDLLKDDDDFDDIPDPRYEVEPLRFTKSLGSDQQNDFRMGLRRHHSVADFSARVDLHRVSTFSAMESLPNSSGPSSAGSSLSSASIPSSPTLPILSTLMEHVQLQDGFLHSENSMQDFSCLSLTLEELAHIRHVLTKADLEALPLDNSLKQDLANNKVCFVCRKTRFGLLGPWGTSCKFCQRTVCKKCSTKMQLPTRPFTSVPIVSLTPNTPASSLCGSEAGSGPTSLASVDQETADPDKSSSGSAPSSPVARRRKFGVSRPQSLYISSGEVEKIAEDTPRRPGLKRSSTFIRKESSSNARISQCTVCKDCQHLIVRHINYPGREETSKERNFLSLS